MRHRLFAPWCAGAGATWRGACPRRVVSWHWAAQLPTEPVVKVLEQALTLRQTALEPLIHTDRGS